MYVDKLTSEVSSSQRRRGAVAQLVVALTISIERSFNAMGMVPATNYNPGWPVYGNLVGFCTNQTAPGLEVRRAVEFDL